MVDDGVLAAAECDTATDGSGGLSYLENPIEAMSQEA